MATLLTNIQGPQGVQGPPGNTGPPGTSVNVIEAPDSATARALSEANPDNVYFVAAG